jgi:hypothetical protein
VLVKLITLRVRSIKCLGWIGSRESNRSRGFLVVLLRHMKQIKNYRKGQGSKCKPAGLIFFLWTEAAGGRVAAGPWRRRRFEWPGTRLRRGIERGDRGGLEDVLTTGGYRRSRPENEGQRRQPGFGGGSSSCAGRRRGWQGAGGGGRLCS